MVSSYQIIRIGIKFLVNWAFKNANTEYGLTRGMTMDSVKTVSSSAESLGRIPVDQIDIQMIDLLRENGRMTNVELAERVGLSPPPCLRRLRFLEEENIILGYKAKVNYKKLGYEVQSIVIVRFEIPKLKLVSNFVSELEKLPEVINIKHTLGNSDLIISLISKNLESYGQFIKSHIQGNDNISSFCSYILESPK